MTQQLSFTSQRQSIMDKKATLDEIFAQARGEEPVMTREESNVLLTSVQPTSVHGTTQSSRWKWFVIAGAVLVASIAIWRSAPVQQSASRHHSITPATSPLNDGIGNNNAANATPPSASDNRQSMKRSSASGDTSTTPVETRQLLRSENEPPKQMDISGIQMLGLSSQILDSLSIRVTRTGFIYYQPISEGLDSAYISRLPKLNQPQLIVPNEEAPYRSFSPLQKHIRIRMITDARGKREVHWVYTKQDRHLDYSDLLQTQHVQDTAALSPEELRTLLARVDSARNARAPDVARIYDINRLIPVRINATDTSYFVFWYEPTAEFLDLLPSHILTQLRLETIASELALYDKDQDSSLRMNDLRQLHTLLDSLITRRIANGETIQLSTEAHPGAPIMEMSRVSDGAISLYSISPNPNHGEFNVRFAVRETRVIDFSVYDINGSQLQAATSGVRVTTEESESVIRLKRDIPPGIYLLVLSTDKGERAVQRLMIE
jgi:hypothetical protein